MFQKRSVGSVSRRKDFDYSNADVAEGEFIDKIGKMMTYRVLRSKKSGLNTKDMPKSLNDKLNFDLEEENDEDGMKYGLLKRKFVSDDSEKKDKDKELEEFILQHMHKDDKKLANLPKDIKNQLYQLPDELNVKDDFVDRNNDKLGWLNGIAEIPLTAEDKVKNIEAVEEAKRDYMKKLSQSSSNDSSSSLNTLKKAFGPRFIT